MTFAACLIRTKLSANHKNTRGLDQGRKYSQPKETFPLLNQCLFTVYEQWTTWEGLTLQSLCMVLMRASYLSFSSRIPSGWLFMKSKSLRVGLDFDRSALDAFLLYVLPFRSYFSWSLTDDGRRLFMTTNRMFLPPHCKRESFLLDNWPFQSNCNTALSNWYSLAKLQ